MPKQNNPKDNRQIKPSMNKKENAFQSITWDSEHNDKKKININLRPSPVKTYHHTSHIHNGDNGSPPNAPYSTVSSTDIFWKSKLVKKLSHMWETLIDLDIWKEV